MGGRGGGDRRGMHTLSLLVFLSTAVLGVFYVAFICVYVLIVAVCFAGAP